MNRQDFWTRHSKRLNDFDFFLNTDDGVTASITATASSIYWGTSVTFTATVTGDASPSYQWKLNGANVGTDSNTYANSNLAHGDVIKCVVNGSVNSNEITMIVGALNAYRLDGSTKYLEFGDILDANMTGTNPTWTISVTFLREQVNVSETIVSKWTGGTGNQRSYRIYIDSSNKIRVTLSSNLTAITKDLQTNNSFTSLVDYYTVDVVKSGATYKIYVNGVDEPFTVVTNTNNDVANSTAQLRLGRNQTTAGAGENYFKGYINQFHLWSTALSGANVLDKYNNGAPKNPNSYGTLIGSWISDTDTWGGSAWTVYDRKASNNGASVNVLQTDRY